MTWNIITMPAAEELAMGYAPSPHIPHSETQASAQNEDAPLRRFLVTAFVIFGLIAGIQNAVIEDPAAGQRRIAEVSIAERKAECRDCVPAVALFADPEVQPPNL